VVNHPAPDCGPVEFGDNAVVYALHYWIADFAHDTTINEEVHARVWYAARRAGLEIPFPIRTLVWQHGAASARAVAEEQAQEETLRVLETVEPFSRLDAESRRRCARGGRRLEFGRGEHVLRPEEPDDCLYLIDSGEVAVHLRSNGTTREVATLRAGELLGRTVLPAHDGCTADSEVVLYRIDGRALEEGLAADPQLGAALSGIAAARPATLEGSGRQSAHPSGHGADGSVHSLPSIRRLFRPR
jgi:hypothetical protein